MPEFEDVEGKTLASPMLGGRLGEPKVIKIVGPILKAAYKKAGRPEANDVCLVLDMDPANETPDQRFTWVVPAIAKSELEKNYPDAKYVGKYFRVVRYKKTEGAKASPVSLTEVKIKK